MYSHLKMKSFLIISVILLTSIMLIVSIEIKVNHEKFKFKTGKIFKSIADKAIKASSTAISTINGLATSITPETANKFNIYIYK